MPGLEQGRVFSGREALAYKLIDQIGGEPEVVKYLEEQRNVPKGLKIVDWKVKRDSDLGPARLSLMAPGAPDGGDLRATTSPTLVGRATGLPACALTACVSIWHGTER